MKKCLATIGIVMCLLILAGCGKKNTVASGDDASLYPYSWQENADGSLTVKISGKWEEDCTWQPSYSSRIFEVSPEKKAGCFRVKGLTAGADEVEFFLRRGEQKENEYVIWLYLSSTSNGDVKVLESTHEEPLAEGDYSVKNAYDGALLFTIHSAHPWEYRLLQQDFSISLYESSDETQTYEIRVKKIAELNATIELWDTESPRKLIVTAASTDDGYVYVRNVEESEDTTMAENTLDSFWQELGIKATIPSAISVENCAIITSDSEIDAVYGRLDVTIGGKPYRYLMSESRELVELYQLESFIDEHDKVIEAQNDTVTLANNLEANVSSLDDTVVVTWQTGGNYFVLCGEDMSVAAAVSAAGQIVGGGNG